VSFTTIAARSQFTGKGVGSRRLGAGSSVKMPVTPLLSNLCKELQQNLFFTAALTLYLVENKALPCRDGVGEGE
jgi:hypothetical protein